MFKEDGNVLHFNAPRGALGVLLPISLTSFRCPRLSVHPTNPQSRAPSPPTPSPSPATVKPKSSPSSSPVSSTNSAPTRSPTSAVSPSRTNPSPHATLPLPPLLVEPVLPRRRRARSMTRMRSRIWLRTSRPPMETRRRPLTSRSSSKRGGQIVKSVRNGVDLAVL